MDVDVTTRKTRKPAVPSFGWQVLASFVWLALFSAEATQKLTLAWDWSVDASVVGYKIYYKESAATNYTQVNVGNTNVFTLTTLREATTNSFYVTCYNAAGLESDPSNTVGYTVPLAGVATTLGKDAQGKPLLQLHVDGMTGKQVILQSSTDLKTWTTVVTSAAGQAIDFTVTNLAGEPKRFYRSKLLN